MEPSILIFMDHGRPTARCHSCGGPAVAVCLQVSYGGKDFTLTGTFECDEDRRHVHKMELKDDLNWVAMIR